MDDPLAEARQRGERIIQKLIDEGRIVPSVDCGDVLAVEVRGNKFCLPAATTSLPGFGEVVRVLRNHGHDNWSCVLFFLNPIDRLMGTPVDALKEGHLATVILCAENYLEHGAL